MGILNPQMSVIVAVYNQEQFLPNLLRSLDAQDCPVSYEVIVCDDGSSDSTYNLIRAWRNSRKFDLRYTWQPDLGFRVARSRNNGIRLAQGDILVFVDGDSWFRPFFLREHWEVHRERRKLVCGGYQNVVLTEGTFPTDYNALFDSIPETEFTDLESRVAWIDTDRPWMACTSGNLSVDRAHILFFDEQFQGWSSEDRDFAFRLYRNGLTIHLLGRAGVVHLQQYGRAVDWNPTKGGDHQSIEAALESKLHLFRKYPGDVMLPSLEMIRYCHLDETTSTWQLGPIRKDVSIATILGMFETWRERNGSRESL